MLSIDTDKVLFVIDKMRELEEEDLIEAETDNADKGDALHLSEPGDEEIVSRLLGFIYPLPGSWAIIPNG